jgi:phage/plasmid primase-like uncharacterized protein/antirestriction protein ArdC
MTHLGRLLAAQIAAYSAPWQQPQRPGYSFMPVNPISGRRYKGINAIDLAARATDAGYTDDRWLTMKQAETIGASLKPKELGHVIRFWSFTEQQGGHAVKLDKPKLRLAVVYNAAQFDGVPTQPEPLIAPMEDRVGAVRNVLRKSGATIERDATGGATRYDAERDVILMTRRDLADDPALQIAAVHQLARWSGHPTRMDFAGHPPGSTGHAREELRATIASMFVGDELRIGFDPGSRSLFMDAWRDLILEDPAEIFRASMVAERIAQDIVDLSIERVVELSQEQMQEQAWQAEYEREREELIERHFDEFETVHDGSGRSEEMPSQLSDRHRDEWKALDAKYPGREEARLARESVIQAAQQAEFLRKLEQGEFSGRRQAAPERSAPTRLEGNHPAMTPHSERTYLAVPYSERDEAKTLGARWDKEAKAWFVVANVNSSEFARWRPETGNIVVASEQDPVEQFADACRARGLVVNGAPIMNGQMQRAPVIGDKAGERSGAYKGYLDGIPAGYIENFKDGLGKQNWKANGQVTQLTPAQRESLFAQAAAHRAEQEQLREASYAIAALKVAAVWEAAQAVVRHPHLESKGVSGQGLKVGQPGQTMPARGSDGQEREVSIDGSLLIPMRDAAGKLTSLQVIDQDGRKQFWAGGRAGGSSYMIGNPNGTEPVLVAEGYATAATLHQATGYPVAVAFNAYNLQAVAEQIRARNPDRPIYVAGDNDHAKEREIDRRTGRPKVNVGKQYAEKAADAVKGRVLLPRFDAEQTRLSDWNDLAQAAGIDGVRRQIAEGTAVDDMRAKAIEAGQQRTAPRDWRFWKSPTRDRQEERSHAR